MTIIFNLRDDTEFETIEELRDYLETLSKEELTELKLQYKQELVFIKDKIRKAIDQERQGLGSPEYEWFRGIKLRADKLQLFIEVIEYHIFKFKEQKQIEQNAKILETIERHISVLREQLKIDDISYLKCKTNEQSQQIDNLNKKIGKQQAALAEKNEKLSEMSVKLTKAINVAKFDEKNYERLKSLEENEVLTQEFKHLARNWLGDEKYLKLWEQVRVNLGKPLDSKSKS